MTDHNRSLKVQTRWEKLLLAATKVLRAEHTDFLLGFLHRHELSIDLQHTIIWRGKTGASYGAIAVMRWNRSSHWGDSGTNSNPTGTRWEGRKLKSRLFQLQINWILLSSEFQDNDWKRSDLICYWPCRGGAYLKNSSFEPTARHSTQDCLQVHTKSLQIGCFELTECQSTRS